MTDLLRLARAAALAAVSAAVPAHVRADEFPYSIMVPEKGATPDKPEPWLAPKYKSPRGTRKHVTVPRPAPSPPQRRATVPPPIPVPETGRVLPNLPAAPGVTGVESGQDRALRCAHQAGVYGPAVGNRGTYIRTCINQ
jgi:hypothetical protein